jgi:putative NADPH-quinone reductase
MSHRKIFILVGHPSNESTSNRIANTYEKAAREAGHEVKRMNLADLKFDPILHKGYRQMQMLEPDLVAIQECVKWCEHMVLIFPTWWGDMPALLKGMFDRMWLPGFAYNMKKGSIGWMKRLKGRSARIVTTSNSNPLVLRFLFHVSFTHLRWLTLWFSGFSPIRMTRIGNAEKLSPDDLANMDRKIANLGRKGK